jgi:CheY-like chemotaxis protein
MRATGLTSERADFMGGLLRLFASARKAPPPAALQPTPPTFAETPAPPKGKKILIVDDDPVILETTSLKLRSEGYAAVTAVDCSDAIGRVRDEQPDLILLDLTFPPNVAQGGAVAWDGFVIMSWLRQFQNTGSIPIIIMTVQDTPNLEERALKAGARALFHKPVDHERLLETIGQVLGVETEVAQPVCATL